MRPTLLLVILLPATMLGGPKPGDEGTPEYQTASDLVRQLGDAKFTTREEAARKLVDMGAAAVPALTAGTKAADEEVRTRSTALLPKAVAVGWKRRAEAFLADPAAHRDLPLLSQWEKLTGTPDAGSRKLYAQVLAAQGPLLDQAAADKKLGAAALAAKAMELPTVARSGNKQVEITAGDVAGILFAQAYLKVPIPPSASGGPGDPLYLLANPATRAALDDKEMGPAMRMLVVGWYEARPADDIWAGQYFALLAYRRPFPEADPILVRLATKHNLVEIRVVAMEALGKAGSAAAVGALKELLDDGSAMHGDLADKDVGHQVRDCALAALVLGSGKDPKAYKLRELSSASLFFGGTADADTITVRILGFASKADREAGIKKWWAEAAAKK